MRRSLAILVGGMCAVTTAYVLMRGFSAQGLVRLLQTLAVLIFGAGVIGGGLMAIALRLADWREPSAEKEFDRVVERAERLGREGLGADPEESEFLALDPFDDDDFAELVRDALDDLPDLLQNVLRRNVAVMVRDDGRRHGAYGLYVGDGATRDDHSDRVIIFRDTLRRDFGHDADLLRDEVTRTVRHELAHHVGFDELGVRELGL